MMLGENIFVQIPTFIFWKGLDFTYLGGNAPFIKAAGFHSHQEIIGKNDYQSAWRDYASLYREGDLAVLDGELLVNRVEPHTQADGKNHTIMVNKAPLRDRDNQICGVIGSYVPLFDVKQTGKFDPTKKNIALTQKEADCLLLLVKGYTAKQIADINNLSVRTIVGRIDNIKLKLNCHTKFELIQKALTLDFIKVRLFL